MPCVIRQKEDNIDMKELSKIALAVEPSSTMAIDTLFKQMKAEGQDVIGFGAGEPDFNTPDYIKEAGIAAIEHNETRYTPSSGTVELRKAICQRLKADCGVEYTPQQISVSNGAKPCVYVALRALINPGDEVILPSPYWVSYSELIKMTGGVPVIVETREADHFKLTAQELRDAITPKTKAMILNNPSNPTGMMYSRKELEEIAKVCVEQDIYVICDEIYYHLVYDGEEFVSLASISPEIKERTLLVNGVSKSYAMTGWRIGYLVAPEPGYIKKMAQLQEGVASCVSTFIQAAAVEALKSTACVDQMVADYTRRRDILVDGLNAIPGITCKKSAGSFYAFPNIKAFGKTSQAFAEELLENAGVVTVPGSAFGDMGEGYLRLVFANSDENLKEAVRRIADYVARAYPGIK